MNARAIAAITPTAGALTLILAACAGEADTNPKPDVPMPNMEYVDGETYIATRGVPDQPPSALDEIDPTYNAEMGCHILVAEQFPAEAKPLADVTFTPTIEKGGLQLVGGKVRGAGIDMPQMRFTCISKNGYTELQTLRPDE